jgi:hypothetical protein
VTKGESCSESELLRSALHKLRKALTVRDESARRARAIRIQQLDDALTDISPHAFAFVAGTPEIAFLRMEAQSAFLAGLGGSAVICAHAACERELAAWVQSLGPAAPKRWTRWGLGNLAVYAIEQEFVPSDLGASLLELNERRRFLYHLQDKESLKMTYVRAFEGLYHKSRWQERMHSLLLRDGFDAIRIMGRLSTHLSPF